MTEKEFDLSDFIGENAKFIIPVNRVKEFIKIIEFDLLKKFKRGSVPIMEIIRRRAGDKLK